MKFLSFAACAAWAAIEVAGDLPIHCLPEDVLGRWTFVADEARDNKPAICGHSSPNTVTSMVALVGDEPRRKLVPLEQRSTFEVTLTNHVEGIGLDRRLVAIGPDGERGQWTMVFDEGFEVRLGDNSYFAHFEFDVLPGQQAKDGDTLVKIGKFFGGTGEHKLDALPEQEVYACHCDRTSIGWHSRDANSSSSRDHSSRHGCFYAYRSQGDESHLTVAKKGEASTQLVNKRAVLRGFGKHDASNTSSASSAADPSKSLEPRDDVDVSDLPTTWDWRDQPELKQPGDDLANEFDQGACGSCYAISGVLALGMRFRIALSRKFGHPSNLDLSWRAVTRCSPLNEGCGGGWTFLVGRHAKQFGVFQQTTTTAAGVMRPALRCSADKGSEQIEDQCEATCLRPDPSVQPVYFASDYGYVGGFAQGASENAIMREIYINGPVAIELAVRAIPMLFGGNSGDVITIHDNARPLHDPVPRGVGRKKSISIQPHVQGKLKHTRPVDFKDWLWADHALLSVGWGEAEASKASNKTGSGLAHLLFGTPKQVSFIQASKPSLIKYWTIRNSWGEKWADKGYGKLIRGQNAGGVEISAVWIKPDMSRLPDLPGALS